MKHFWCWLLGHKWHEVSEYFLLKTNVPYFYFCERCGATAGNVIRKDGDKE